MPNIRIFYWSDGYVLIKWSTTAEKLPDLIYAEKNSKTTNFN